MDEPAALGYARELIGHQARIGGKIDQLEVLLSVEEAFELVAWFYQQNIIDPQLDMGLLMQDIDDARRANDPWIVLDHFTLLGMKMQRRPLH